MFVDVESFGSLSLCLSRFGITELWHAFRSKAFKRILIRFNKTCWAPFFHSFFFISPQTQCFVYVSSFALQTDRDLLLFLSTAYNITSRIYFLFAFAGCCTLYDGYGDGWQCFFFVAQRTLTQNTMGNPSSIYANIGFEHPTRDADTIFFAFLSFFFIFSFYSLCAQFVFHSKLD